MAHCIQAIVTTAETADRLQRLHGLLPRVSAPQGFAIFPVDAEFVDSVTSARPPQNTETFMLLTDAFHDFLCELSRFGTLAYVETDYFGGIGGQGAVVYSNREVVVKPEWRDSGPINRALERLGVKRSLLGDRFSALGLDKYRSNDDLLAAAATTA